MKSRSITCFKEIDHLEITLRVSDEMFVYVKSNIIFLQIGKVNMDVKNMIPMLHN